MNTKNDNIAKAGTWCPVDDSDICFVNCGQRVRVSNRWGTVVNIDADGVGLTVRYDNREEYWCAFDRVQLVQYAGAPS